jgi:hypothetical protein
MLQRTPVGLTAPAATTIETWSLIPLQLPTVSTDDLPFMSIG